MSLSSDPRETKLQQWVADMPKELTPTQDLWQGIEKRMDKPLSFSTIKTPKHRYSGAQWALAASVVLAIFFSFFHFNPEKALLNGSEQAEQLASQQTGDEHALQTLLSQIAQTHQTQVANLTQSPAPVVWQARRFSAPLEQGLVELRQAGEQIFQALQANPTDKQLWQLWLWVQQRELDLLQQSQKLSIQNSTQGNSI